MARRRGKETERMRMKEKGRVVTARRGWGRVPMRMVERGRERDSNQLSIKNPDTLGPMLCHSPTHTHTQAHTRTHP